MEEINLTRLRIYYSEWIRASQAVKRFENTIHEDNMVQTSAVKYLTYRRYLSKFIDNHKSKSISKLKYMNKIEQILMYQYNNKISQPSFEEYTKDKILIEKCIRLTKNNLKSLCEGLKVVRNTLTILFQKENTSSIEKEIEILSLEYEALGLEYNELDKRLKFLEKEKVNTERALASIYGKRII